MVLPYIGNILCGFKFAVRQNFTFCMDLMSQLGEFRKIKKMLHRGTSVIVVLTSSHYRRSLLVQGGLEMP